MKKGILKILLFISLLFSFLPSVYAAKLSISANSKTVTVGDTVTVTVKASGLVGKFSVSSSDSGVLSGGTSSVWLEDESETYQFKAKSAGSATVTITPENAADYNGDKYKKSSSVTITVVKPREKSDNNNLKSLSVDGYELTPGFDKDTLEYNVNIDSYIEKINISAAKEDGYASLEGTGEKEVFEGTNKFEVRVTSETGKQKTYTINIMVKDANPIIGKVNGKDYTVIKRAALLPKLDDLNLDMFTETTVMIDEVEIPAFYNETAKLTLVGLVDESGNSELYQYNEDSKSYQKFEILTSKSKTVIFEDNELEDSHFKKTTVTIHDQKYNAYQSKDNKNYVLIYGMDIDTGEKNWYLYQLKEESIQTYMNDLVKHLEQNFDNTLEEYKTIILAISGLSLLLFIIIIFQIISKHKMKKKFKRRMKEISNTEKRNNTTNISKQGKKDNLEKNTTISSNQKIKKDKTEEK